ncbi:transcription initiation factor TFIID subunit 4-like [Elgaria multicarinata webbii]|uniref:transcription initiation factor TFIID subunit 4-like n=1 Tax=Elgaria multicarinata webbii TaxID=159646 RepID=UPI002FCCC38E
MAAYYLCSQSQPASQKQLLENTARLIRLSQGSAALSGAGRPWGASRARLIPKAIKALGGEPRPRSPPPPPRKASLASPGTCAPRAAAAPPDQQRPDLSTPDRPTPPPSAHGKEPARAPQPSSSGARGRPRAGHRALPWRGMVPSSSGGLLLASPRRSAAPPPCGAACTLRPAAAAACDGRRRHPAPGLPPRRAAPPRRAQGPLLPALGRTTRAFSRREQSSHSAARASLGHAAVGAAASLASAARARPGTGLSRTPRPRTLKEPLLPAGDGRTIARFGRLLPPSTEGEEGRPRRGGKGRAASPHV